MLEGFSLFIYLAAHSLNCIQDAGYALLADISDFNMEVAYDSKTKDTQV